MTRSSLRTHIAVDVRNLSSNTHTPEQVLSQVFWQLQSQGVEATFINSAPAAAPLLAVGSAQTVLVQHSA
jgi:hypothetical protein